jgi:site-specific recombinase XerD
VFVDALEGPGGVRTLRRLEVTDIEDFFIDYAESHGNAAGRSMQAAMRLFLRFAAERKWVSDRIVGAVPTMRSRRSSGMPRGLSQDQVRALVAASTERSLRDHAIVLLFAVYGVRRGQVSRLRLEDINWRDRVISFAANKGGKAVKHTLAPAVAAAMAAYLQHERPDSDDRAVFLRSRPPHWALSPESITKVVRIGLRKAGITCVPRSPHALRHAFATRLLCAGQPVKVIADLLGHRTLDTVSTYAKLSHPRLLEIAPPWPEVN